jgi:hypothetical protein
MSAREPADVERLRAALAARRVEVHPAEPADAGRIFDAVHGELSAEERAAIVDASIDDADAAEVWRLAMELRLPQEATHASARHAPWRWLAVAAAVALTVGLGWQIGWKRGADAPIYRGVDERTIGSLLPADSAVPRQAPVLRWTPIEGARYRIRVLTADLEPLDEASDLAVAEYALPPEVAARVPAGATVLWQVEADVPGEATVVSPTFATRLQ